MERRDGLFRFTHQPAILLPNNTSIIMCYCCRFTKKRFTFSIGIAIRLFYCLKTDDLDNPVSRAICPMDSPSEYSSPAYSFCIMKEMVERKRLSLRFRVSPFLYGLKSISPEPVNSTISIPQDCHLASDSYVPSPTNSSQYGS